MMELGVNVIVLRVRSNTLGELWNIPVMGKTLEQWSALAVEAPYQTVEASPVINLADKIKPLLDKTKPLTVLLYCDTPLLTAKSVSRAAEQLKAQKSSAVQLARGGVFKTSYLSEVQSLYLKEPTAKSDDAGEFTAVTDSASLSRVTDVIRRRILAYNADKGVMITDFSNTYIDCDAVISAGAVIEPYNFIKGKTVIKSGAHIMPGNYMENCIIEGNTVIDSSRMYKSYVGEGTRVGPFAYLRPNTVVGKNCRIGDFVELKNCVIGDGCKISHLTYVGDAQLGVNCNVGCGVVFANYDGKNKYKSVVGDYVFIGSNANIVAPVSIADRAFIAAGSTITSGVPEHALAIARARQSVIPDWQGNLYAPASAPLKPDEYNLVQYADGIIDGAASESVKPERRDAGGASDPSGAGD